MINTTRLRRWLIRAQNCRHVVILLESKGALSGDIKNLSGSVPVHIGRQERYLALSADFGHDYCLALLGYIAPVLMQMRQSWIPQVLRILISTTTHTGIKMVDGLNCKSGCLGGFTNALRFSVLIPQCSGIATCFPLAISSRVGGQHGHCCREHPDDRGSIKGSYLIADPSSGGYRRTATIRPLWPVRHLSSLARATPR
jgi:hypothetical protein